MDGSTTPPSQHSVQTPSGRINYIEKGKGPVALFVHGVLLKRPGSYDTNHSVLLSFRGRPGA